MNDPLHTLTAHPVFLNTIAFVVATLFILLLVRLMQYAATNAIGDKELRYKTRKAIGLAGYAITLVAAIAIFSDQMANLAVIIGALSVGIGFALREMIQNLIGWGIISFGGLFKPGDRIQMGGIMGDVMDIGPQTTTLMECGDWVQSDLYNGRVAHLPNNFVLREKILNYTADYPFLWDEIVVPIRTDSDYRLARSIIIAAGKTVQAGIAQSAQEAWANFTRLHHTEESGLEPVTTLSFDANWIEITLRYVVDYRTRRATKGELFSAILAGFAETDGKVRVATPQLRLAEASTVSVRNTA